MANEKRLDLIDRQALGIGKAKQEAFDNPAYADGWNSAISIIDNAPTVDALPVDEMREFAKGVVYQFGTFCQLGGRLHITTRGLTTMEWAFDILGWDDPHPVPECECEIDGCHEYASCGVPTSDGYKRIYTRHFIERREGE